MIDYCQGHQINGTCHRVDCPQLRDGEPAKSGRVCPIYEAEQQAATERVPTAGIASIARERQKQVNVHGYNAAHDDKYDGGLLALAGAAYAMQARFPEYAERVWPFDEEFFKPSDDTRDRLVIAGAFIVAEIDRLDRGGKP